MAFAPSPGDRAEWPKTDFVRRTVDLAEIQSGGSPKDGIPAIDRPRFVSPDAAKTWLKAKESVIALRLEGEPRAYPLEILMFHEIVNDKVAGHPVAVTFCPLCNASIEFDRRVDGVVVDFRSRGANTIDTATGSEWNLFGEAVSGPLRGRRLVPVESGVHFAFAWLAFSPASEIVRELA